MRPISFRILALVLGVFLASCVAQEDKPKEILIGAVLELTGDGAEIGKEAQRGIELAATEINERGGINGHRLMIVYEDARSQAAGAVSALQKLIATKKPPVVLGALFSTLTLAMAPIAEANHIILFSPGSSNPAITSAGDYIFRNYPSDTYEGKITADYVFSQLRVKKIAILFPNNDYGIGLRKVFSEHFLCLGGSVRAEEAYTQGLQDFRTHLSKIKQRKPSLIYVPGYFSDVGRILKQAHELGIQASFIGNVGLADPTIIEIAGKAAEGLRFTTPVINLEAKINEHQSFGESFAQHYGHEPGFPAAFAYDAVNIVALAMQTGGISPDKIKNALYRIQDYEGVTGKTGF